MKKRKRELSVAPARKRNVAPSLTVTAGGKPVHTLLVKHITKPVIKSVETPTKSITKPSGDHSLVKPTVASTSKPATGKRTAVKPVTTKPTALTKLAVGKPVIAKPTVNKPPTTKPVSAKPTVSKPAATKPSTTKPVVIKSTVSKPTLSKPTVVQPTIDKPAGAKPTVVKATVGRPPTVNPTSKTPTVNPTRKPATANPTSKTPTVNPTSKPATPNPTSKPATCNPTSKPAVKPGVKLADKSITKPTVTCSTELVGEKLGSKALTLISTLPPTVNGSSHVAAVDVIEAYNRRAKQTGTVDPRSFTVNKVINGAKFAMMTQFILPHDIVIDYASGQSADTPKLIRLGVSCILNVDGSSDSLEVAKTRQISFENPKTRPRLAPWILPTSAPSRTVFAYQCLDLSRQGLFLDPGGPRANVVLCHNALHYLPIATTLRHIATHLLAPNGFLSVLCIDASRLCLLQTGNSSNSVASVTNSTGTNTASLATHPNALLKSVPTSTTTSTTTAATKNATTGAETGATTSTTTVATTNDHHWFHVDDETESDYRLTVKGLVNGVREVKIFPTALTENARLSGLALVRSCSAYEVYEKHHITPPLQAMVDWPLPSALCDHDRVRLRFVSQMGTTISTVHALFDIALTSASIARTTGSRPVAQTEQTVQLPSADVTAREASRLTPEGARSALSDILALIMLTQLRYIVSSPLGLNGVAAMEKSNLRNALRLRLDQLWVQVFAGASGFLTQQKDKRASAKVSEAERVFSGMRDQMQRYMDFQEDSDSRNIQTTLTAITTIGGKRNTAPVFHVATFGTSQPATFSSVAPFATAYCTTLRHTRDSISSLGRFFGYNTSTNRSCVGFLAEQWNEYMLQLLGLSRGQHNSKPNVPSLATDYQVAYWRERYLTPLTCTFMYVTNEYAIDGKLRVCQSIRRGGRESGPLWGRPPTHADLHRVGGKSGSRRHHPRSVRRPRFGITPADMAESTVTVRRRRRFIIDIPYGRYSPPSTLRPSLGVRASRVRTKSRRYHTFSASSDGTIEVFENATVTEPFFTFHVHVQDNSAAHDAATDVVVAAGADGDVGDPHGFVEWADRQQTPVDYLTLDWVRRFAAVGRDVRILWGQDSESAKFVTFHILSLKGDASEGYALNGNVDGEKTEDEVTTQNGHEHAVKVRQPLGLRPFNRHNIFVTGSGADPIFVSRADRFPIPSRTMTDLTLTTPVQRQQPEEQILLEMKQSIIGIDVASQAVTQLRNRWFLPLLKQGYSQVAIEALIQRAVSGASMPTPVATTTQTTTNRFGGADDFTSSKEKEECRSLLCAHGVVNSELNSVQSIRTFLLANHPDKWIGVSETPEAKEKRLALYSRVTQCWSKWTENYRKQGAKPVVNCLTASQSPSPPTPGAPKPAVTTSAATPNTKTDDIVELQVAKIADALPSLFAKGFKLQPLSIYRPNTLELVDPETTLTMVGRSLFLPVTSYFKSSLAPKRVMVWISGEWTRFLPASDAKLAVDDPKLRLDSTLAKILPELLAKRYIITSPGPDTLLIAPPDSNAAVRGYTVVIGPKFMVAFWQAFQWIHIWYTAQFPVSV